MAAGHTMDTKIRKHKNVSNEKGIWVFQNMESPFSCLPHFNESTVPSMTIDAASVLAICQTGPQSRKRANEQAQEPERRSVPVLETPAAGPESGNHIFARIQGLQPLGSYGQGEDGRAEQSPGESCP